MLAVSVLLVCLSQLGWRAGTPEPVLADSPDFVRLYWRAWENYHQSLIDAPSSLGVSHQVLAFRGQLRFLEGVTSVLYSRWGWRATPSDAFLTFWCSRVASTGEAPEAVLLPEGLPIGRAEQGPFLGLCIWELFEMTGSRSSLERQFSAGVREYFYWASFYEKGEPPRLLTPGEKPPKPKSSPPPAIPARAQAMLLMDAEFLRRCARALRISEAESFFRDEVNARTKRFLELWDAKSKTFRLKDPSGVPLEGVSLEGLWAGIGGHLERHLPSGWDEVLVRRDLFLRKLPYPRVPASDAQYSGNGGVFPFDQYRVIRALLDSGQRDYAGYMSERILRAYVVAGGEEEVLYSEYGADTSMPAPGATLHSPDGGFVVIGALMEGLIGIRVSAEKNTVTWSLWRTDEHGVRNLRFGENRVSLVAQRRESRRALPVIEGECEKAFTLVVMMGSRKWERRFPAGRFRWELR